MTDTEAKALAHSLRSRAKYYRSRSDMDAIMDAGLMGQAADYIEATEARHAAEMRELKERFSEVAAKVDTMLATRGTLRDNPLRQPLAPFIIPAPDPLVEVFDECFNQNVAEGETWSQSMARKARTAIEARGGKIVWEAGE